MQGFEIKSEYSDIIIKSSIETDAIPLYYSKFILERNDYFKAMLKRWLNENNDSKNHEISEITLAKSTLVIKAVLNNMLKISNDFSNFKDEEFVELLDTSREYMMEGSIDELIEFISKNMDKIHIVTLINHFSDIKKLEHLIQLEIKRPRFKEIIQKNKKGINYHKLFKIIRCLSLLCTALVEIRENNADEAMEMNVAFLRRIITLEYGYPSSNRLSKVHIDTFSNLNKTIKSTHPALYINVLEFLLEKSNAN